MAHDVGNDDGENEVDIVAESDQVPPGDNTNPFDKFQQDLECKDEGPEITQPLALSLFNIILIKLQLL